MGVGVSTRRQVMAWALAAISLPLLTVLLTHLRGRIDLPADLLIYLLAVMGVTTVGGTWPGLGAAVAADLLANWYFIPPIHTFTISDPQNILALVAFLIVAGATSFLVGYAARRAEEATRGRAEAAALVRMAGATGAAQAPGSGASPMSGPSGRRSRICRTIAIDCPTNSKRACTGVQILRIIFASAWLWVRI